ncbi:MAG TPA: carbohydrate kinase family protein [Acidimicrobiales bacterium]|nr:carbohydrate kinase family protein [Acidimicrobiales bacterium]
MTRRVVVLGDVMLDVIVQLHADVAPSSDTPSAIRVTRGGSGANLAIALRHADHDVIYVGAAGRDAAADVFVDALSEQHVTPRLESFDGATGTVVSIVARDGQRSMLTDRGVNPRLSAAFVATQLDHPFDHLHVSGYLLLDDATRDVSVDALALARQRGSSTSVDVCSVAPLRDVTPAVFLHGAEDATMLFANEEEALTLTSRVDVEGALDLLASMFDEVVVTVGARGVVSARGTERFRAGASDAPVVDTTGAGDAATGAYLGARLNGVEPQAALADAMEAAARVVSGLGALG